MTPVAINAPNLPRAAARPVTFSRTIGLFTPAADGAARAAVLFLSPWGLEELCVRKAWRELADALSDIGIASLRYDHPGTGDALDPPDGSGTPDGFEPLREAAHAAAAHLRGLSGVETIILVAQGFGALLVPAFAGSAGGFPGVAGVALLAPVTSGRRYLRELSLWSKVVDEGLGLAPDSRDATTGGASIAGLSMGEAMTLAVRSADLKTLRLPETLPVLVVERPQSDLDAAVSQQLQAGGSAVTRLVFTGYSALVSNPTIAQTPVELFRQLIDWIVPFAAPQGQPAALQPSAGVLDGGDFIECPMRFGPGDRLFGILSTPAHAMPVATALIFGTGYDRQSGWARSTVETARALAGAGIASLRFDAAGIADSPPVAGGHTQVLYAPRQIADVRAALDLIEAIGLPDAVFVGRCSGAYLAFNAALSDPRCRGVIAINILSFAWDPRDDVDQMIRYNPRSMADYRSRAFRLETLGRILSGKVDLHRAARNIARLLVRRVSQAAASVLGPLSLSVDTQLRNRVHAAFRNLQARRVPVSLVFSEGDIGLSHLDRHLGKGGVLLKRYPNVTRHLIADADHNVTPPKARADLRAFIQDTILAIAASEARGDATADGTDAACGTTRIADKAR
jgi:alpha-beta hydrolase superfamily lysophospholipase